MEKNRVIIYGILIFIIGAVLGLLYGNAYGLPFHDQGQKSKAFMEMEEADSDGGASAGPSSGGANGAGGKGSGTTKPVGPAGGGTQPVGPAGGGPAPVGPKSN